jgi:hypothetical protein
MRTVLLLNDVTWALKGVSVGWSGGSGERRGEQRRWRGVDGCFTRRRKQVRLGLGADRIRMCGWSADSVDARWRTVTEPPWPGHVHACTLARHAAMGHRGLLAHGPYPLKPFSKLSQRLKFKTKVFPMSKNTQIFRSIAWNIWNNFPFWPNLKFP